MCILQINLTAQCGNPAGATCHLHPAGQIIPGTGTTDIADVGIEGNAAHLQ